MCTAHSLKLLQTLGNAQLSRCVPNALRLRIVAPIDYLPGPRRDAAS